ncbi:MAG: glycoside hydrolase family 3 N-terminal domain-containing protein [Bacteroidales bacterium]|jgi:beta-glucosidase
MNASLLSRFVTVFFAIVLCEFSVLAQKPDTHDIVFSDSLKVERLLKKMTIDEKVGQLSLFLSEESIITGPSQTKDSRDLIRAGKVGGIFNVHTVDNVHELQRIAMEESRLKIPLLFGLDVIHGYRTIFPIPIGQACSWDLEGIEKAERIAATEATAEGIDWTFAPMVDLARDPRWGRVSEGAGEDTWLGCRIAEARVRGFQGKDLKDPRSLLACAKHFAAYGAALAGRDYNTVDMSTLSLYEWYLPIYNACVEAGVGSIMTSFNEINGTPSTSNKWLLTDILRKSWRFKGFVVTDFNAINELIPHGVAEDLKDAARLALNAGVDMDMQGSAYITSLSELLNEKKITLKQIDEAVRRILLVKFKMGLFDDPYRQCTHEREKKEIFTHDNLAFARKIVSESCVLLKNEKNTLPIPQTVKSIAVIGPLADSKQDMLGNWNATGRSEDCITLLGGIRGHVADNVIVEYRKGCNVSGYDTTGFKAAVKLAGESDFVILALGEEGEMSGEASSRSNIDLPGIQNELAQVILKIGKPTVVVLFNGRPLAISNLSSHASAILETWFGGTQAGNGIADVLFGDYNPSGKLTMTFPRNVGQVPIFYNTKNTGRPFNLADSNEKYVSRYIDSPNTSLYPFGYGLSYTSFAYSNLIVGVAGKTIKVEVTVTNSGNRDGEEIAQLYVHQKVGSITRPVKELKGFQKVLLKKGEAETISFSLSKDDLAFFHPDLKRSFEPGEYMFFVGGNSVDTMQKAIDLK